MLHAESLDDRFELEELVGKGGMGSVHRAFDRRAGVHVAVKLLSEHDERAIMRFEAEARLLSELVHPHIVRYIAHGVTARGQPYLVMEWLEGESLWDRLSRVVLSLEESVLLARRVAEALAVAHARGVVHRDIKPSNLFLVDGQASKVKVLDFGIARVMGGSHRFTRTGGAVGTPGYMAPEQARGERERIDARADVFSLGCVLFECLAGRPAFEGSHMMALLAKLLMEEAPRLREFVPRAPDALDDLIARMLSKAPELRPAHGAAMVAEIDALGDLEERRSSLLPPSAEVISGDEQRLLSIVALMARRNLTAHHESGATLTQSFSVERLAKIRQVAALLGGRVDELVSGAVLVSLTGTGNPADQAAQAASCALRLRMLLPDARMALVTGRAEARGRLPLGSVIERAAALLDAFDDEPRSFGERRPVGIDGLSHALLAARFEVQKAGDSFALLGEREVDDEVRRLLGKPTPCVGRERELSALQSLLEATFDDDAGARAVLVTGPAGIGKSRLRHELVRQLREQRPGLAVAVGRGDSMSAGSAFALLGSALRSAAGITGGEPAAAQRERLSDLVGRYISSPEQARVVEFLGEVVGTPFPDEHRPHLRAARHNASIMADQIPRALLELVSAVCAVCPLLLVFEDLHWGDVASINLIDRTLRELSTRPLVVLAFGRPEVRETFPSLWDRRAVQHIRLGALPVRAAEQLVRGALGGAATADVARLVARASGNAFYLEELIRAVAEGRGDELPETVLGMVEARLEALPFEARRILRAASVFGETFWASGVLSLLGETDRPVASRTWLSWLVDNELIVRRSETRFAGEEEYSFRHALLREGAYAMLTERDRQTGHKWAAEWLLGAGEHDAKVLAEHFAQGGEAHRAIGFYRRAAEQALGGSDLGAAIALADRAMALGAAAEVALAAELRSLQADASLWGNDWESAKAFAQEARSLAPKGSASECRALGTLISCATFLREANSLASNMNRLLAVEPREEAVPLLSWGYFAATMHHLLQGERDAAERHLGRLEAIAAPLLQHEPAVSSWVMFTRANWARQVEADAWRALELDRAALSYFERVGDRRHVGFVQMYIGTDYLLLGAHEEAEAALRDACSNEQAQVIAGLCALRRARSLVDRGDLDAAYEIAASIARAAASSSDHSLATDARLLLASVHVLRGEFDDAEREAMAIRDDALTLVFFHGLLRQSTLASTRLGQGRFAEALALAEEGIRCERGARMTHFDAHASLLATRIEARLALGDTEQALRDLAAARDDILDRARRITDRNLRRSFLEKVPVHAHLLALCRTRLSPEAMTMTA